MRKIAVRFERVGAAVFVFVSTLLPLVAYAADPAKKTMLQRLNSVAAGEGRAFTALATSTSAAAFVGGVIKAALALIGVIFFAQMVYAGYLWMTARGESDQVDKAKETITRSMIGIAIVLAAWAITSFVVDRMTLAAGVL